MSDHSYFNTLNYSLANEDTWIEHELAPKNGRATLAIAGSGSRVLPLLARAPERLDIVDLSTAQLRMTELRIEACRQLDYEKFLYLLGYSQRLSGSLQASRQLLFERLRLTPECRNWWSERQHLWSPKGFILLGRWENHFIRLGRIFKTLLRLDASPIFEATTLEEQRELVKRHWHPWIFRGFLKVVLSDFIFRRFLYGDHYAGAEGRRTQSEPAWKLVDRSFDRFFQETLIRKNYFLQMIFLGELRYPEGFPCEASPGVFSAAKNSRTDLRYVQGDYLPLLGQRAYDFYSLSDTISYLPTETGAGLLERIRTEAGQPATVVIRSFMRKPELRTPAPWKADFKAGSQARLRDCTGVYEFLVFRS